MSLEEKEEGLKSPLLLSTPPISSSPLPHLPVWEHTHKVTIFNPERRQSSKNTMDWHPDLKLMVSKTIRNKFLLFILHLWNVVIIAWPPGPLGAFRLIVKMRPTKCLWIKLLNQGPENNTDSPHFPLLLVKQQKIISSQHHYFSGLFYPHKPGGHHTPSVCWKITCKGRNNNVLLFWEKKKKKWNTCWLEGCYIVKLSK